MRFVAAALFVSLGSVIPAQILHVNAAAPAGGNGSSWATAFNSLQTALAAATAGSTVWVAQSATPYAGGFNIPAGVTVLGGFLPGDLSVLQRYADNTTILTGNNSQRVVTLGAGSVLDGFQIQNGQAATPGGGGALIDGVNCKIRRCIFRQNNDSVGAGAALLVRNGANPQIESCVFFLNGDAASGAAIDIDGAGGKYLNLTIDLSTHSGLRFKNGAAPQITSCCFSNNGERGIVQLDVTVSPVLQNNLFFANAIALYQQGATDLTTLAQVNALPFAAANLAGDPKYAGGTNYRVLLGSTCIDAGSQTTLPETVQCLYDYPRVLDGVITDVPSVPRLDIGAHEYCNATLDIPVDNHQHVHVGVTGLAGSLCYIAISGGELPSGLFFAPFGHLLISPVGMYIGFFNTLPVSSDIPYPPGVPAGVPVYFQAFVTKNAVGFNLSNPQVHITN